MHMLKPGMWKWKRKLETMEVENFRGSGSYKRAPLSAYTLIIYIERQKLDHGAIFCDKLCDENKL